MIAWIVSPTWNSFHASSPHVNVINANPHPAIEKFVISPTSLQEYSAIHDRINACEAIVVDYPNWLAAGFYKSGPKFLVWGDEHCHTQEEVATTEDIYTRYDYILSGAPFAQQKTPPYFYISEEAKAKRLYFPPSVPDVRPRDLPWAERKDRAVLMSNSGSVVYPFRHKVGMLAADGAPIDDIRHFNMRHAAFFEMLGTYCYGVTCNSTGWLNYTVSKYFEIPYMGTALIAPKPSDLECYLIGFEGGENVIWTSDPHDVIRIIDGSYTMCVSDERVAAAGAELMSKYHTVSKRFDYVSKLVECAKSKRLTLGDSVDIFKEVKETHGL